MIALSCAECGAEVELDACDECYGEGRVMGQDCDQCNGSGAVQDGEAVDPLDVACRPCWHAEQSSITSAWVE